MNITTIKHQPLSARENLAFRNTEVLKKSDIEKASTAPKTAKDTAWQQSVLLDVISGLEQNLSTNENHPLGRADYRPIDSFEEAISELSFLKTDTFKAQALGAQANIRPQDIASLFNDL